MHRKIILVFFSVLILGSSTLSNLRVGYAEELYGETIDETSTYYQIQYDGGYHVIEINNHTNLKLTGWTDESRTSLNGELNVLNDLEIETKEVKLDISEEINELALSELESIRYQIIESDTFKVDIIASNILNDADKNTDEFINKTEENVTGEKKELSSNTPMDNDQTVDTLIDDSAKNNQITDKTDKNQIDPSIASEDTAMNGEVSTTNSDEPNQFITSVTYSTHVQDHGWQAPVSNGEKSGTSGEAKRLEAIKIFGIPGISYRTHVQDYGWQNFVTEGELSGTSGEAKRLEAIQIKLTGEAIVHYDIYYRVHAQDFGWLGWAKNGQSAGTAGFAKRLEAIEIRLVPKDGQAPGGTNQSFLIEKAVTYSTHVQDYGWMDFVKDGALSGTSGKAKRLEAIKIQLKNTPYPGKVVYSTHVQDYGWLPKVSNGAISGTSGKGKRLEAITIDLTGEIAKYYDIYYRVHIQDHGWLGWAKNGMKAGSQNQAKRLEGIEIKLVLKKQGQPVDITEAFKSTNDLHIPNPLLFKNKLISHAMGEIDGYYYTNSLEAFQNSYFNKGSRVFEVDFELTYEGKLVARHDWRLTFADDLMQIPETSINNMPWTYNYFMQQPINKKYTPLDIHGIIDLLIQYPDIIVITDTKHLNKEIIEKQFLQIIESANYDPEILNRIIPQIYNQEMLTTINTIYQFDNIIYTLYLSPDGNEQVINFVKENLKQITAVTMPTVRTNKNFIDKLHSFNVSVYTHPIWTIEEAIYFNEMGVDGFYSASITKQDLENNDIE